MQGGRDDAHKITGSKRVQTLPEQQSLEIMTSPPRKQRMFKFETLEQIRPGVNDIQVINNNNNSTVNSINKTNNHVNTNNNNSKNNNNSNNSNNSINTMSVNRNNVPKTTNSQHQEIHQSIIPNIPNINNTNTTTNKAPNFIPRNNNNTKIINNNNNNSGGLSRNNNNNTNTISSGMITKEQQSRITMSNNNSGSNSDINIKRQQTTSTSTTSSSSSLTTKASTATIKSIKNVNFIKSEENNQQQQQKKRSFIKVNEATKTYDQFQRTQQQREHYTQGNLLLRLTVGYTALCDNLLRKQRRKEQFKHQIHVYNQMVNEVKHWRCTNDEGMFYVPEVITGIQHDEFLLNARYKPLKMIGRGTYSCTILCVDTFSPHLSTAHHAASSSSSSPQSCHVAIKVMHAKPSYDNIGMQECMRLRSLSRKNLDGVIPIVKLLSSFYFQDHYCLVFELLHISINRIPLRQSQITQPRYNIDSIRIISSQLLSCISYLSNHGLIHADIKPDNILFKNNFSALLNEKNELLIDGEVQNINPNSLQIKLVDFGNSMTLEESVYYYEDFQVQTLPYRAPEVLFF